MKIHISILAVASLIAAPAGASVREAAFASSADRTRAETSMFVGMNYQLDLSGKLHPGKGRASLKVAGMVKSPNAQFRIGEGLALAPKAKGKPTFLVGGQELRVEDDRANLSKGATVGVIVVGVLAVAAAAAYLALRDPCDGRDCE